MGICVVRSGMNFKNLLLLMRMRIKRRGRRGLTLIRWILFGILLVRSCPALLISRTEERIWIQNSRRSLAKRMTRKLLREGHRWKRVIVKRKRMKVLKKIENKEILRTFEKKLHKSDFTVSLRYYCSCLYLQHISPVVISSHYKTTTALLVLSVIWIQSYTNYRALKCKSLQ